MQKAIENNVFMCLVKSIDYICLHKRNTFPEFNQNLISSIRSSCQADSNIFILKQVSHILTAI